jgi:GDP-4-dehydro-6-deoxy-D-mannose reductase
MKIFITGIYGSCASYLAEYILDNYPSTQIHGCVRNIKSEKKRNIRNIYQHLTLHEYDLTDFEIVKSSLNTIKPDIIFNLASDADVRGSFDHPISTVSNNIHATHNIFEAVRILKMKPVIKHCSTSEVYGESDTTFIQESHLLRPSNPYAVSKATQDMLADVYFSNYQIPIIRTRMFTYINPRRLNLFASNFARQIVAIERGQTDRLRHGNLESTRTIIDVRDGVRAYWLAVEKGSPGEVYNIGGSHPYKVGDVLDLLIQKARTPIKTEVDPSLLRPTDLKYQLPDSSKFINATGWKPKYSLDESLDFLLEELRSNE